MKCQREGSPGILRILTRPRRWIRLPKPSGRLNGMFADQASALFNGFIAFSGVSLRQGRTRPGKATGSYIKKALYSAFFLKTEVNCEHQSSIGLSEQSPNHNYSLGSRMFDNPLKAGTILSLSEKEVRHPIKAASYSARRPTHTKHLVTSPT